MAEQLQHLDTSQTGHPCCLKSFQTWECRLGAAGVVAATREVEDEVPFALMGFDTDNGSEFLNWHLLRYFQECLKAVGFTRSRPHQKDA